MYENHIRDLVAKGWIVERSESDRCMPRAIAKRYPSLPEAVSGFLLSLDVLSNPDRTAWFLCGPDYDGASDAAFRWNEFERLSLEAAQGDIARQGEVRSFWDAHFPFFLSVKADYSYFALALGGSQPGGVVGGVGPDFEDVVTEASSLTHFLERLALVLRGGLKESTIHAAI